MFRRGKIPDIALRIFRKRHIIRDQPQFGRIGISQKQKLLALRHDDLPHAALRHLGG